MKRILVLIVIVLIVLLVQVNKISSRNLASDKLPANSLEIQISNPTETAVTGTPTQEPAGMPGWPIPNKPIPHHEPGQPARSGAATYQVSRLNALGVEENVEIHGLDAALANGTMTDPLQGNYRLVRLDKLMFSNYGYESTNGFTVQSFELVTPTMNLIPNSDTAYGDMRFNDIAAGDLNGDLVDEQIAAWVDRLDNRIYMNVGEMPGLFGKTTSAPAVVAHSNSQQLDVLVRGYDDALWQTHYNGTTWENWNNHAGGVLLSSPTAVSRAAGELDVFAIGLDNQVYHQHKGEGWDGWTPINGEGHFPATRLSTPLPAIYPPAAVARGGPQLDLFRLGPDNTLWWCHSKDGASWNSWSNLGGMLASGPGAISLGDGRMQVYALGMDGALWYRTYDNDWSDWERLETPDGVARNAFPVLISPATGQVTVYLAGTENQTWEVHFNGSTWENWSSIPVQGGELDTGIGTAVSSEGTYLFAQMNDGSLQYSLNASNWTNMEGLYVSSIDSNRFVTGAVTKALPGNDALENNIFDLTTGYFTGDGREQIALAYEDASNSLRLEIYDMSDGFRLAKAAELTSTIANEDWPRVAAGDVNGDGVDEIGFVSVQDSAAAPRKVILRVFQIEKDENGQWTRNLSEISSNEIQIDNGGDLWHGWPFGGTLRIEAGDINPEADPTTHDDEFAVVSDWRHDRSGDYRAIKVFLHLYDYQASSQLRMMKSDEFQANDESFWNELYATGIGLAVGNVDGQGTDEIVVTWPVEFEGHDYPDVRRNLLVYRYNTGTSDLDTISYWYIHNGEWSRFTFLDTLVVGDLDQDLADEIVMVNHWYQGDTTKYYLNVLEYNDSDNLDVLYQTPWYFGALPRAFNLAMGDFTGESLRVGPPTYRVQNRVDTLVSVINMPPKHQDLIQDANGEYQLIQSPLGECDPSPDSPNCTHAKFARQDYSASEQTLQTVHAYELSAGMENETCAGGGLSGVAEVKACTRTSINATHGGNFEKSTEEIQSIGFRRKVIAANDDKIVFFGTPYGVWEYPVLSDATGEPVEGVFITVAFPLISITQYPDSSGGYYGGTCDETWFTAGHQPNNVWSYDPIGDITFPDYNPDYEPAYDVLEADWAEGEITYDHLQSAFSSVAFHHAISARAEVETSAKASLGVVDVSSNFKAYVQGDYSHSFLNTDKLTTSQNTTFSYFLAPQPDSAKFLTRILLYRGKDDSQIINYQAEPGRSASWQLYNKPDPAFILPWYGFPNPDDPQLPPCGEAQKLFSPDVVINPRYASLGETVTISATVRNFSDVPVSNVRLKFYQGYPGDTNLIGQANIAYLDRANGPQTVSIPWVAAGVGQQKIYAVIDPNNEIDEMHEAGDLINNNMAYGLIQLGAAAYADMGQPTKQPYDPISYTLGITRPAVSLYVPRASLSAVARFEVGGAEVSGIDETAPGYITFAVNAYQGSKYKLWDEPIDNFNLKPEADDPPAVITVAYTDADVVGQSETDLTLYRLSGAGWVAATCENYYTVRFPADNLIAVPICQTGVFVLSTERPEYSIFLPLVLKAMP